MKRSHLILWIPCFLYYAFITGMSSVPGKVWETLAPQSPFPFFDKVVHLVLYGLFGMVLARALFWEALYQHIKKRWYLYFLVILPLVSAIDEFHQHFVPDRSLDFWDLMADFVGATGGAVFYVLVLRGRGGDRKKIDDLEESDVRGFGLILAMTYFMALMSLNLLNYKRGVLKGYTHLTFVIILIEYGLLGLLTIRFFYLRRDRQFFLLRDWLLVSAVGGAFIAVYQLTLLMLRHIYLKPYEVIWSFFCYFLGAVFYYLDKQIERFRKRVVADPFYKRKTWQRVYFFLPPVIIALVISFLSTQTPTVLYQNKIPPPTDFIPETGPVSPLRDFNFLHGLQFFILGLFYFRAVTWECWWHASHERKNIWSIAYFVMMLYAFCDEIIQYYVPGRAATYDDVVMDVMGGTVALVLYMFGYRLIKERYFANAPHLKNMREFPV